MTQFSFLRVFCTFFIITSFVVVAAIPLLHNQLYHALFKLNLDKNREQAERLATLVSIELERGEDSAKVLSDVQNMLENTLQSSEHFACIIEHENKVIAHPKPSNINKDTTGWTMNNGVEVKTFTQSAGEGVPFGGIQTRNDGSQDINYQIPISTKPWAVSVHTKLDIVDQQATKILLQIGLIVLPSLLFITVISALLVTRQKFKKSVSI
ncbi:MULTISPECIES: hypothetical protein [Pseudoalteromonas]|uniref:Two-component sensor histidine kinase n=1 Tax=Pseudoalteromonas obscura TaxID=3048491 RepID=A0ABT7EFK9_9GAMM|nr:MULTISPECIES: hypothetical protein [Pseudoalteromonas]MBQ4835672.1 hypothetical protein [Pseudoalteromonas luteoviolacea]MDK2594075.1 hypothetical protein [Pseudoalteromonas sp. P94(2023)]